MNARAYNKSITALFFGGDPLGVTMRDGVRQLNELSQEARELRRLRAPEWYSHELPCPCGCGQIGPCDAQLTRVIVSGDEIPF